MISQWETDTSSSFRLVEPACSAPQSDPNAARFVSVYPWIIENSGQPASAGTGDAIHGRQPHQRIGDHQMFKRRIYGVLSIARRHPQLFERLAKHRMLTTPAAVAWGIA